MAPNTATAAPVKATSAKGILFILAAGVFFSVMSLGVRLSRQNLRADTLVFYRSLFQALILLPCALTTFRPAEGPSLRFRGHLLRGVFGIVSMLCLYIALRYLPMGLAHLLAMTSILWASVLSRLLFDERGTRSEYIYAAITAVGILVTLVPVGETQAGWSWHPLGVGAGLLCGLSMGTAVTVLRQMRKALGTIEIVFFFGMTGVVTMLPSFVLSPQWPTGPFDYFSVGLACVGATLGQLLMTVGYRYTTAMLGSLSNFIQVLFTLALGLVALGERPPAVFFIGSSLVLVGLLGVLGVFGRRPFKVYKSETGPV